MRTIFGIVILCISCWTTAFAKDVCYQNLGSSHLICTVGTVSNINYSGDVSLNGTTVTGNTSVSGDLDANGASLNTVSVRGDGSLTNTLVSHQASFSGNLKTSENTQCQSDLHVAGNLNSINSNFNTVSISGDLVATGSRFSSFEISGDARVTDSRFLQLGVIRGDLTANDSLFSQTLDVKGNVFATNVDFQDELTIVSNKAVFKNSRTKLITDTFNSDIEKNIYLQDSTSVNGSIIFQYGVANNNIVHRISGSSITGQVTNGIIADQ